MPIKRCLLGHRAFCELGTWGNSQIDFCAEEIFLNIGWRYKYQLIFFVASLDTNQILKQCHFKLYLISIYNSFKWIPYGSGLLFQICIWRSYQLSIFGFYPILVLASVLYFISYLLIWKSNSFYELQPNEEITNHIAIFALVRQSKIYLVRSLERKKLNNH